MKARRALRKHCNVRAAVAQFGCMLHDETALRNSLAPGGTSEGAMTVSRFDDGRYGHQVLGRAWPACFTHKILLGNTPNIERIPINQSNVKRLLPFLFCKGM